MQIIRSNPLPFLIPPISSVIVNVITLYYSSFINIDLKGLDDVFNSVITFTSIIIGVLVALFGIIVSISDTDIMLEIRRHRGEKALFIYCLETLISNFILLVISMIMQILINYSEYENMKIGITVVFYVWIFVTIYMLASSIRTIYYLLLISFNQNNNSNRPTGEQLSDEERTEVRNNFSNR